MKTASKRITALLLAAAIALPCFGLAACSGNGNNTPDTAIDWDFYNTRAEEFITTAANGDFDKAAEMFDDTMTEVFGAQGLRGAWEDVTLLTGAFIEIHNIQNAEADGYYISGVILRCEQTGFGWNVVFNKEGQIAGLNTGGTIALTNTWPREQEEHDGYTEYPVTIGEGTDYPLNGLLSIPTNAAGQTPAVVIVGGSGAHNMDGAIYGKTPYRDIARYLAQNGIAVIRFDKRTFAHGEKMVSDMGGSLTVWEESIEDAISAAELLKADPRIDANRVYLIGHSLGGMLAPRIHISGGDFAGLIIMAGTPRGFADLYIEQSMASIISGFDEGYITEEERNEHIADTTALKQTLDTIPGMTDEEAKQTYITDLGIYAYYLKDMDTRPFAGYAKDIAVPVLVMQGGRDFQILADTDFEMIKDIFADKDNVTYKLYDNLNHMFMQSEARSFVQHAHEITSMPGQPDEAVLKDIADWINSSTSNPA